MIACPGCSLLIGIKDIIDMMAERYGTVGRWAGHLTLWLVVTAIV